MAEDADCTRCRPSSEVTPESTCPQLLATAMPRITYGRLTGEISRCRAGRDRHCICSFRSEGTGHLAIHHIHSARLARIVLAR